MTIPAVEAPETEFDDMVAPVALALEQERRVSDQIAALNGVARDEGDYLSEQFVQWFLKEQVEEVADDVLAARRWSSARARTPMSSRTIWPASTAVGEDADPTAPPRRRAL